MQNHISYARVRGQDSLETIPATPRSLEQTIAAAQDILRKEEELVGKATTVAIATPARAAEPHVPEVRRDEDWEGNNTWNSEGWYEYGKDRRWESSWWSDQAWGWGGQGHSWNSWQGTQYEDESFQTPRKPFNRASSMASVDSYLSDASDRSLRRASTLEQLDARSKKDIEAALTYIPDGPGKDTLVSMMFKMQNFSPCDTSPQHAMVESPIQASPGADPKTHGEAQQTSEATRKQEIIQTIAAATTEVANLNLDGRSAPDEAELEKTNGNNESAKPAAAETAKIAEQNTPQPEPVAEQAKPDAANSTDISPADEAAPAATAMKPGDDDEQQKPVASLQEAEASTKRKAEGDQLGNPTDKKQQKLANVDEHEQSAKRKANDANLEMLQQAKASRVEADMNEEGKDERQEKKTEVEEKPSGADEQQTGKYEEGSKKEENKTSEENKSKEDDKDEKGSRKEENKTDVKKPEGEEKQTTTGKDDEKGSRKEENKTDEKKPEGEGKQKDDDEKKPEGKGKQKDDDEKKPEGEGKQKDDDEKKPEGEGKDDDKKEKKSKDKDTKKAIQKEERRKKAHAAYMRFSRSLTSHILKSSL